jgi:microsomal dipeptidase-like Zn-dependent dipeptidase
LFVVHVFACSDPRATVEDLVDEIDYPLRVTGIERVGIRRGYTAQQIAAIGSGNLLRLRDRVQAVAGDLARGGVRRS